MQHLRRDMVRDISLFFLILFISIISLIAFAGIWNFTNATVGEDIKNDLLNNIKEEVKENTKNKEYKIDSLSIQF